MTHDDQGTLGVVGIEGRPEDRYLDISDENGIGELLAALASPDAGEANLQHTSRPKTVRNGEPADDHQMTVGVDGVSGYGYLARWDADHDYETTISLGSAESPVYIGLDFEFDAGSGISIETLRSAIAEFLTTATRPTEIYWRQYT